LGVADLARSCRFYKDGLGLPTTRTPDEGIVFFRTQGVAVALYPYAKPAEDIGPGWVPPPGWAARWGGPRAILPAWSLASL
jgi:catechol 2,3-dioxygenase-like lactoylglutathione lyase family enzyme